MTPLPFAFLPLSADTIRPLLAPPEGMCVSILLPTHRRPPANEVDRPTFRGLVATARRRLAGGMRRPAVERILAPLDALERHPDFWAFTREGLAVFAAAAEATGFLVSESLPQAVVVGARFHTLPLVRLAAGTETFELLVLSGQEARVYEGGAVDGEVVALDPLPLPAAAGAGAAVGLILRSNVVTEETREPHRALPLRTDEVNLHGGFNARQDVDTHDTAIFLRHVDRCLDGRPHDQGPPLLLAAAARLGSVFRRLTHNRRLLAAGIEADLHHASVAELALASGPVIREHHRQRVARLLAAVADRAAHGKASSDLAEIGPAAVAGRVAGLVVERGRPLPGSLDPATGAVRHDESGFDAGAAPVREAANRLELLDRIAEAVVLHRGDVTTVPAGSLIGTAGVAAVFRY